MTEIAHRPRRSALYMPGANTRALEKAKTLAADMLLLDLEDAVAPEAKAEARAAVCAAVKAGGYGQREVVIRVNGLDTEWGLDDMAAAVAAGPDGVLAPKVIDGGDIDRLDDAMSRAGAPREMGLWVMIEMPKAILNIQEIAEAVFGAATVNAITWKSSSLRDTVMRRAVTGLDLVSGGYRRLLLGHRPDLS